MEETHKIVWMGRCWSCQWPCLALLSTVRHAAESRSYHGCFLLNAILDVSSPGHVFTKSPTGEYSTWLPPQLLCVNEHSPSLCRAGTFNTCLFPVLSVRIINYAHPWTSPCTCIPTGTLLPTPKDGAEIRNQGKAGSLKWTQHCSINWQQQNARQSENLNNRNIGKYFEWKLTNPREVWDVPGDNSSASLSWLCTIS